MLDIAHIEAPVIRDMQLLRWPSVVVAGAYKGDTVAFIRKWHPTSRILACEPQLWAWELLATRFRDDPSVIVSDVALGAVNTVEPAILYEYETDACSLLELPGSRKNGMCYLHNATSVLRGKGFAYIDLLVLNLEGYEYKLIPWLLAAHGLWIQRILVQWHFMNRMDDELTETRILLSDCRYTGRNIGAWWELWQK